MINKTQKAATGVVACRVDGREKELLAWLARFRGSTIQSLLRSNGVDWLVEHARWLQTQDHNGNNGQSSSTGQVRHRNG